MKKLIEAFIIFLLTATLAYAGLGGSGAINANNIFGTTTNDNACAGCIGEYQSATLIAASAVSLTTATPANIISLSLTAGDWDVDGIVCYHGSGTTNINDVKQGTNTTSATIGVLGTFSDDYLMIVPSVSIDGCYVAPTYRYSLASTTTTYLVGLADFTVSTTTAYGFIRARRIR